jgi:hypothetical protein
MSRAWRELDEDELRELQEKDDEVPHGWRLGQEGLQAIEGSEGTIHSPQDYHFQGDAEELEKLVSAVEKLESADAGKDIAEAIQEHGTTIKFGPTDDAVAQFDPAANEITISETQEAKSPEVLAAYLAHEGTHVQWGSQDSIDQEYHAFKAQDQVWNEVKAGQEDPYCDAASAMISQGEARCKREIRLLYPELPEY